MCVVVEGAGVTPPLLFTPPCPLTVLCLVARKVIAYKRCIVFTKEFFLDMYVRAVTLDLNSTYIHCCYQLYAKVLVGIGYLRQRRFFLPEARGVQLKSAMGGGQNMSL